MATGAAERLLGCVFEGCIASPDNEIERRPYHRNCGCALHRSRGSCTKVSPQNKHKVSYPMRRARSETCLALVASASLSSPSSKSSSPTATVILKPERTLMGTYKEKLDSD